jgi:ribonuclease E
MAQSLSDVLSDKPEPKAEAPQQEPAAEPKEAREPVSEAPKLEVERNTSVRERHRAKELEAQGRGPDGKFLPKAPEQKAEAAPTKEEPKAEPAKAPEKPAAEPAKAADPAKQQDDMTPRERAAFAKAADETRKRQALEARLAALEKPAASPQPPKQFWDDPEGAMKAHKEELTNVAVRARLDTAEMIARSKYTDFQERVDKFSELVTQIPGLAERWLASPDPAEFAYKTAKNHAELEQVGSLEKMRSEIETKARAEERAKVEAEFKARQEALDKERAALPPSLSDARGAARPPVGPVFSGPTPLGDILGGR